MKKVLAGVHPDCCLVYLDDLLVHGMNLETAMATLEEVQLGSSCTQRSVVFFDERSPSWVIG